MNALAQHALRPGSWFSDDLTTLTPEACRILPSGHRMPLMGLGTWNLTVRTVETLCNALELGFRMVDTAASATPSVPAASSASPSSS